LIEGIDATIGNEQLYNITTNRALTMQAEGAKAMKGLPKAHIATNPKEIAVHGKHVDLIAQTSTGSHQVRVIVYDSPLMGKVAIDPITDEIIGDIDPISGDVILDDQHNISARFDDIGRNSSINLGSPDYFANREDALMGNGQPDPRGTAMGGYNPRR